MRDVTERMELSENRELRILEYGNYFKFKLGKES